jgi:hypothetical protein
MISVVTSSAGDRVFEPREQVNVQWEDDEIRFVLEQHAQLDLYSDSSLTQQSADRHVAPMFELFWNVEYNRNSFLQWRNYLQTWLLHDFF